MSYDHLPGSTFGRDGRYSTPLRPKTRVTDPRSGRDTTSGHPVNLHFLQTSEAGLHEYRQHEDRGK